MNDLHEQVFNQAKYIAKLIMPVSDRAVEVNAALIAAADDGDIQRVIDVLENNRAVYWHKTSWGRRGVMVPEVKLLADNLLAKIDHYGLRPTKKRKVAA